jgi:hypothetical protein
MSFKKLPASQFGPLLQALYNCEHHFHIEWMWDGGFEWGFGCSKKNTEKCNYF